MAVEMNPFGTWASSKALEADPSANDDRRESGARLVVSLGSVPSEAPLGADRRKTAFSRACNAHTHTHMHVWVTQASQQMHLF
jgi:hypothetical protein